MKSLFIAIFLTVLFTACNSSHQGKSVAANGVEKSVSEKQSRLPVIKDTLFNFENEKLNQPATHWSVYYTGRSGQNPDWKVLDDNGNKVWAQMTGDNPNYHFNVAVFDDLRAKDVSLEVKFKGVSGRKDQGGGFVWRFTDAGNYYVVRANPLEDNVVLYKVVNGKRTDLPVLGKGRTYGVDVPKLGNGWNTLKLVASGNLFSVYLNGKPIFQVKDDTFTQAGKIGLWTKADAVTYFDDYRVVVYH